MAKRRSIQWKDDLSRPIVWSGPRTRKLAPNAAIPEPTKEAQERNAKRYDSALERTYFESLRKLKLVKRQLRIPRGPGENLALALSLATMFIPGFELIFPGEGRGRKRRWTDFMCIALICDVEATKEALRTASDIEALRKIVSRKNHYIVGPSPRTIAATNKMAKTLNARLVEARRRGSDERFHPFAAPEARRFFHRFLRQAPELLQANFD